MKSIPLGWYYAGKSQDFTSQPRVLNLPDKTILTFRSPQGQLHATQSRCPHMNADLSKGTVTKTGIVCPLHKWHFSFEGACGAIPGLQKSAIPEFACLSVYSIFEHHGHVFILSRANTENSLPFFANEKISDFHMSRPYQLIGFNNWDVAAANGFDLSHFEYVHQRIPQQIIKSDFSDRESCHLSLTYQIRAKNLADRWIVKKYGDQARLDYSVYNGNLVIAKTTIGHFHNRMMIFIKPFNDNFRATLFVFTPKNESFPLLKNKISAYFSYLFFKKECSELSGVHINPNLLGDHEKLLKSYYHWLQFHSFHLNDESSGRSLTAL
jgi:phenylpropionate dioxygenase-like ring-hydroxylating dioxygenase large terminal subunit